MAVFLGYRSGIEAWRSGCIPAHAKASRAKPQAKAVPNAAQVWETDFAARGVRADRVHLVVADAAARGKASRVAYHVWKGPASGASFVRVAPGVYVGTPEACFAQMATELSVVELILLGFELCSTYALDPDDPHGFLSRGQSLTTVADLDRFVAKMEGMHGCKRAKRALRFVIDGSASPMESALAMLLWLPTSFGGYGLRRPRLNYEVTVVGTASGSTRKINRRCDLYWPESKLAVEYESDLCHTGPDNILRDSVRRTELAKEDVHVITVTKEQLLDARKLDEVAHALARLLGMRLRCSRTDWMTRRFELRAKLLTFSA